MKISKTKTVAKTKYLNLCSTNYKDKKGRQRNWVFAERPNQQNAVVIVPIVYKPQSLVIKHQDLLPRIAIIKEYRIPLEDYEYGLPAGLIDPGESIIKAIIRELKEETNLDYVKLLSLSKPLYNSPGLTNEACHIAYVIASGIASNENTESSEDITVDLYDQRQLKELIEDPSIKIGAKSYLIFKEFIFFNTFSILK
jgi:ADP-ribose pyrophosphatase